MDVGALVVADTKASDLVEPRERPLDDPAPGSQTAAVRGLTHRNQGHDMTRPEILSNRGRIVAPIADHCGPQNDARRSLGIMRRRGPADIHGAARSAPASRSHGGPGEGDGRWASDGSGPVTARESLGPSWHAGPRL